VADGQRARAVIEVTAGIIPDEPAVALTRRWSITSDQWADAQAHEESAEFLATVNGQAQGYAALLMLQPDKVNWVHLDWIWL
jgi:hypothetical protein